MEANYSTAKHTPSKYTSYLGLTPDQADLVDTIQSLRKSWESIEQIPNVRTLEQAIAVNTPTIAQVNKAKEAAGRQLIGVHIIQLVNALNVANTLTSDQLVQAARLLSDEYWYLTLADLKVIFTNAMLGKYGELYNRLDVQVISGWFAQYSLARTNAHEHKSNQLHEQNKEKR